MTTAQCQNDTTADSTRPDGSDAVSGVQSTSHPLVAEDDLAAMSTKDNDISLGTVVRQWMRTSDAVRRQSRPAGDDSPLLPTWTPPREDTLISAADLTTVATPALPRRRRQPVARPTRRLAVLIDAESTGADSADALFDAVADQGTVSVCRAYGDWTSPKAREWWPAPLRQHGIQPYHHFSALRDHRSLVALTIDAVDLARESAVDVIVIVGDLVSLHPLIVRLNASGIEVIAFGTTPTPHDVRTLCHEFVDLSGDVDVDPLGKHRA